jgi:gamma-glutamyltranspeptidase/glutathione hydrolase
LLAIATVALQAAAAWGASPPPVRARQAMVVSPERQAGEIGVAVMRDGGNAVDAAVAVSMALSVTYPLAAPLGGGGFILYRLPDGTAHALDFRERAPAAVRPGMFLDEEGRPLPGVGLRGGLAVGVPGTAAGLAEAHRRWGSLPWERLVRPAVALARDGIDVYPWLAAALARRAEVLAEEPGAAAIFLRDGRPLDAGERLVQADLAATLERIARDGADGFYRGPVADALVEAVGRAGGVMSAADLADYRPALREPLVGSYRGRRVLSFPPPSSGGIALLQILGMLERFDLAAAGPGSSLSVHLVAEASRRAFADRSRWLGDPDHVDVPSAELLAPDYLARRAAGIRPRRATPSRKVAPLELAVAAGPAETLHFSIGDPRGGALAATITLNQWFGSAIVPSGTGVLLNDEMDDFALAPGVPNAYGLLGDEANAVAGGKRPLSSMTPTIVDAGAGAERPLLVTGSPGGSTIISTVAQLVIDVVDYGMPVQAAVDAPRFHHQWQPDAIQYEPRAFPADVVEALRRRGHELVERETYQGNANTIATAPDGSWLGAADPRRQGRAAGF